VFWFALACVTGPDRFTFSSTLVRDSTMSGFGDLAPPQTFGDCPAAATLAPVPSARLLLSATAPLEPAIGDRTVTDASALSALLAGVGLTTEPVDFAAEDVAILDQRVDGTCGLSLAGWDVLEDVGVVRVTGRYVDASYDCSTPCADSARWLAAFAVPKGALVTSCRIVGGGCGEPP
jgi:hypothetical protein